MLSHNNEHHKHGEDCGCGHEHHHDNGCGCGECRIDDVPGAIRIERKKHDEAIVISGTLTVFAEYGAIRRELAASLEYIAREVASVKGVVGHIKASATVTHVDMYSVTDMSASVKGTDESEIQIILAAIVFLIPPEDAEAMVRRALERVKASA